MSTPARTPGARIGGDGVTFRLWAPQANSVELYLPDDNAVLPMEHGDHGYHTVHAPRARAGSRYFFRRDGADYPDPASRFQPEGVHGPSQVVDFSTVPWTDRGFEPPSLSSLAIYELHIGTFTPEGTFAAAAARLPELAELGVTAVEVMPIAEFSGRRNWGYDGVALYAAESSYGGPLEFARFVNTAHEAGIAVLLDVVFNHFGPEGNYSGQFGPYLTDRYHSPWGDAVNVDGPGSDEVREFFHGCLRHWMEDCHVDGFRLDAIEQIHDESAVPFLAQLTARVEEYGRTAGKRHLVMAESDLNDRRVVLPRDAGGFGMDAAWSDDFHHAVHAHLTGERNGYYADFGTPELIARAIERGWCYAWDYSVARDRHHSNDPSSVRTGALVFCTQNHDQVGNRMLGERLRTLVGSDAERAARALLLLLPYVPLIFMGQEYGEERPFLYFVDHRDEELLRATRDGRAREFAAFHAAGTPPDPGAPETRERSVLEWSAPGEELALTRKLLSLRRQYDCFRPAPPDEPDVARTARCQGNTLVVRLDGTRSSGLIITNLSDTAAVLTPPATASLVVALASGREAGGRIRATDQLRLGPYEFLAGVWPARSASSDR